MMIDDRTMPATLYAAFRETAARLPLKAALRYKGEDREYRSIGYRALEETVARVASSLARLGIAKGDRVAILATHGPEWVTADLACLKLGAVIVPLFHTLTPSAVKYILSDSSCKLAFVANKELFGVIDSVRSEVPFLERIVVFDSNGISEGRGVVRFRDLVEGALEGRGVSVEEGKHEGRGSPAEPPSMTKGDPATIVYTSGTTGRPKGVVLSHGNILFNAFSLIRRFDVGPDDEFLSFLPLCHMFERTCGYYTMLFAGATIAYAEGVSTIVSDVQKIRPTIIIVVPRIVEKIYEAVERKVMEAPLLRRTLVLAAVRNLNERVNRLYRAERVPLFLRLKCLFYGRLVAQKFRNIAGGRLRLLVSGGAPLDRKLAKTLHVLGFNIIEGYGLTETAPVVCTSTVDDVRLGTVGKPFDGVEVRIGESDEILVRGPSLMCGYFNLPDETARAIDADGWFHTGDRGRFDERANLVVTGRIKDLIVTSYGKKVAPAPIEADIAKSPYVDQVLLFGDNKKFITALLVLQREAIERYAREKTIEAGDYAALLAREETRELIADEIERATAELAPFEKVRAFALLAEGFTVANELLTPTLKLRRSKVVERYRDVIEALYASCEER
jgi:long-chain acyl-CoA synthetase